MNHSAVSESFPAFYGDPYLKQFLVERLYELMDNAEGRWPSSDWPAAALVRNDSPEVFERITGLPYGLACVFRFLLIETREEAEPIFEAIAAGADTRWVPLQFVREWLSHEALDWPGALASAPHDALRRSWLDAAGDMLGGLAVSEERWAGLRQEAQALTSADADPYRLLEDNLAKIIARMSPPPPASDAAEWRSIVVFQCGYTRHRLLEYQAGWTKRDSARPILRHRWFDQQIPLDAERRFDANLYDEKNAQWRRENADFVALESAFFEQYPKQIAALTEPFRIIVANLLKNCGRM